ncbi:TPA: polysaccharide pyruvyl transferase family protein [Clostridium perfringens]|nr:polysaccharide pyruvyl transferase family protein [Clostridium perfringens]
MKKIGILTFHRAVNYGAVLQTYALQTHLNKNGCSANIINYMCPKIENDYSLNFFKKNTLKEKMNFLFGIIWSYKRKCIFKQFRDEYLIETKEAFSSEDMMRLGDNLDVAIVGSDQVWQESLTNNDLTFFLKDFPKCIKFSYAASFLKNGNDFNKNKLELLNSFRSISVREEENELLLKGKLTKDIKTVCDPVLLLEENDWKQFISNTPRESKNYVLVYYVVKSEEMLKYAEKLAKERNCELIVITTSLKKLVKAKYYRAISPVKFVELFYNADVVVTSSFHGVAFSVIFNKDLYTPYYLTKGKENLRVINLLNRLGIQNRYFDLESLSNEKIDYNLVNEKKKKFIDFSKDFIEKSMN